MEPVDDLRIPVDPTRIGEIGIGSFLIIAGGILYTISCVIGGTFVKKPARFQLHLVSTSIYGAVIIWLTNAKRRSRWVIPEEVSYIVFQCIFALVLSHAYSTQFQLLPLVMQIRWHLMWIIFG